MSILDEILSVNTGVDPIQLRQVRAADWLPVSSAFAAHQALEDGFEPSARAIDPTLEAPLGSDAILSIQSALKATADIKRIVVEQQQLGVVSRETADAVIDSGIKKDAKVIIRITDDWQSVHSMASIARSRLVEDGPAALVFDKFSVQMISLPDEERFQLSETFGRDYVYGFGRRPQQLRLSGVVLNGRADVRVRGELRSMDFGNAFLRLYDDHYRLTPLLRRGKKVVIYGQDVIYTGYLISMIPSVTVDPQNLINISLAMLVKSKVWTKNNDNFIPGTLFAGGLYLPGKETPKDYFSEARLAAYFDGDYGAVLDQATRINAADFEAAARESLREAGAPSTTVEQVEQAVAEAIQLELNVAAARQPLYYDPILDIEIDRIYLNKDAYIIKSQLDSLQKKKRDIEEREKSWVSKYNPGGSFKVNQSLASLVSAATEYQSISTDRSKFEAQLVRVRQKQPSLNRIATNLRELYARKQALAKDGGP